MATERSSLAEVPRITPAETEALLNRGQAVVVDVRSSEDYANGHIPGAISAPLNRLRPLLTSLPHDKTIIFY